MQYQVPYGEFSRLFDAGLSGVWAVDPSMVNIDDLLCTTPGALVRCLDVNAIRFIPVEIDPIGCVAGWISDEA